MNEKEAFYITESKRICKESGMDPNEIASPKRFMTDTGLLMKRETYGEILSVVSYFSNKLLNSLTGTPILIVISDSEGYLLDMVGDEMIQSTVAQFGIKRGSLFTQEDTGTNVISLVLQQKHPLVLKGQDHYHKFLYEIACYGAPFCYTDEEQLLGTVCIMMPIVFQNPLFLTMLSQVVDSIERELLLRKQNKKLNILNQVMLTRSKHGIIITNEKGIITEINEYAQQISNQNRATAIGKNIINSKIIGDYFNRIIKNEEKFENEELIIKKETGEQVVCLFDAQPVYKGNKLIGAFGQIRDITDRYLIEAKIKEAEKQALAGRIAAGIAHEIRNPLTTVRGYLQLLNKDIDDHTSQLFSNLLIPEIDRANKIITDFLSIAKPSSKELEMNKVHCFLLDYLWKFLESEALLHNVELNIDIHADTKDRSIQCNREELLQVFINLFQNSLQAKGEAPLKIKIETSLLNSFVQFIFCDNGKGIHPSILAQIFDPFFSTKDDGTGLGLSVSRKIIENHRGAMYANSNENGTEFIIELPFYS